MEYFFCFVPCVMFDGFSSMHFDLIDLPHMSSFYYVNWDDPIYDQFDDYMEKLEQEEEKTKQDQRSKGTVRLDYKVYHCQEWWTKQYFEKLCVFQVPRRPSKQPPHGPQVEDVATK